MSDFPEEIHVGQDYDTRVLELEECGNVVEIYDYSQRYIRADLVPQWQPIEMLATTARVILLYDTGHIESGWPCERDGKRYIMTGHGKIGLNRFTHFFIVPEMPK